MRNVKIVRDVNAHIQDLQCSIELSKGTPVAKISFLNLAYGNITAIKFTAQGYNAFGDVIKVGNSETFSIIVQDIDIGKDKYKTDLLATLPNSDVRQIVLVEDQVCYADGTVTTYDGKNEITFELREFDTKDSTENEQIEALKEKFNTTIKYIPKEFGDRWICGCGCINTINDKACASCTINKSKMFDAITPEKINQAVMERREAELQQKEAQRREEIRKLKESKKRKLGISVAIVICIVFITIIAYASVMSNREIYASEEDMRAAMQGTWKCSYNSLIIDGDKYTIIYDYTGTELDGNITWNYKQGTFENFQKYIVNKGGRTLACDKYTYTKESSSTTTNKNNSVSSVEDPRYILDIAVNSVYSDSSYTICTGSVTNSGKKTYTFVEVKGVFKDGQGNVVDTDSAYAVGSEGLAPGETTTFRMSVPKNSSIKSCSVSLLDYD